MIHEKIVIAAPDGSEAYLMTYFWDISKELYPNQKRPVILICPGGSYAVTSDREAEAVALAFMAMGYHTAVLRYSVAPKRYPVQLLQVYTAIRLLRQESNVFGIRPDQILVMGFSAGGHLAASAGIFHGRKDICQALDAVPKEIRPDGMLLCYPVITSGVFGHEESFRNLLGGQYEELCKEQSLEAQVDSDTAPAFVWHSCTDASVMVENSLLFVQAMHKANVSVEFHMFAEGNHGIGLADERTANPDGFGIDDSCRMWSQLAEIWLNRYYPWWQETHV